MTNQANAQTCNEPAVELTANAANPYFVATHTMFSDIIYTNPSTVLPNVEFIIVNKSLTTTDGINGIIVGVSSTGAFQPSDYNIADCQSFSITPISYDLVQLQNLVQGILTQDYMPNMSCCTTVQMLGMDICTQLTDIGITQGSDITSISSLFSMIEAITGTSSELTLDGVGTTITMLNSFLGSLGACAGGVTELCYAMDTTANDHYVIRGAELISFATFDTSIVSYPMSIASYPNPGLLTYQTVNNGAICLNDFVYTSLNPDSLQIVSEYGNFVVLGQGVFAIQYCPKYETNLPCDTMYVRVDSNTVAIEQINAALDLNIYPNPAKQAINISFEQNAVKNDYTISISDLAGRKVYNENYIAAEGQVTLAINVESLAKGLYILTLSNSSTQISKKIIID